MKRHPSITKAVKSLLLQAVGTSELNVDKVVRLDNKIQQVTWDLAEPFRSYLHVFKMVIDRRRVCIKPIAKTHSSQMSILSTAETDASSVTVHSSIRLVRTNLC